ncbi:MAG TPA: sterol desaturase family protein [Ferruginibacter sp.]|jgi:sterol desaturase/sphingolipid hydroxylase (fatty acid hydroxylase superfamily)|nr:sterol desaturase family protein [Ferruginibacter sp.]MBN8698528.1 sterol desaturase family protein [Chitinophagales bacterium]HNG63130.1 sterol desaturase family protein [Ferruginibacter sp.]
MKFEKIHNKGQARIFKNQYLEYLTKTHPLVIWGLYLPIIGLLLYYSATSLGLGVVPVVLSFLGGMFFWTLFEYTIHRYAFHYVAESERATRFVYIIHGNHHEYPRDKERLFMPPVPSLLISTTLFVLFYLAFLAAGATVYVFSFFPGFVLGYLIYGTMHYAIHAWNPPFKWMKGLWRNHHLHHYKNEHLGFGVSSTLWDHVFGTMFDLKKEKEDKEKVKELMFARSEPTKQLQEH